MNQRNFLIICNPKSGKGKPLKWLPAFESFLNDHHVQYTSVTGLLPKTLSGFTDLAILGGDGTLNFVLNHFKEIPIPISIIPCGTGNDIAHMLHGKLTQQDYFMRAFFAAPQQFDAGVCNGKYFMNGVGIGFDGWVVKKLLAKKLFTGKAAYYSTVISLLLFYRESMVTLKTGRHTRNVPLFMLCAANGKTYGGGFKVAPYADFNDGVLEFLTVTKISLFNRLKYLPVIEKGEHLTTPLPFIHYEQGTELTISSPHNLQAHLDGEWMESTHFDIRILPKHLRIRY